MAKEKLSTKTICPVCSQSLTDPPEKYCPQCQPPIPDGLDKIYDKAHAQAMIFGAGFIRIDLQGFPSNVSIDEIYKQVQFIKENAVPEAKDPCE